MKRPTFTTLLLPLDMATSFTQRVSVPEPEFADQIYLLTFDTEYQRLLREPGIIRSKAGASLYPISIRKIKARVTLSGPTSSVIVPAGRGVRLIIKAVNGSTDLEPFINIFPFEVRGKRRRAQLAEAEALSATKTNSLGQISFKAKKYRQSSYYTVVENLKPGGYGILSGNLDKRNEKNGMKITTFSIK